MKQAKLFFAVLCAVLCIGVLAIAASASSIYVNGSTGDDSNDGLTADTPVATLTQAKTLLDGDASIDTVYISGTVTVPSNNYLGVSGRTVNYRGLSNSPQINYNGANINLYGPITLDDLNINMSNSAHSIYTMGYDVEVGPNVTGQIGHITSKGYAVHTTAMNNPWTITVGATANVVKDINLLRGTNKFTGHAIFNVEAGGVVNTFHNPGANGNFEGIEEINVGTGATVVNFFMHNASATSSVMSGLRYIRFDGTSTGMFYIAGANQGAASASNTGVAVFEFGPNASISNLGQNGLANETNVTHVYIFNHNSTVETKVNNYFASAPNGYAFQVDDTGTVSAYMSTMPTDGAPATCVFGGIQFDTTYSHALIDGSVEVALDDLSNNKYPVSNFSTGMHTVTFYDGEPTIADTIYIDATNGNDSNDGLSAAAAKKTFAAARTAMSGDINITKIKIIGSVTAAASFGVAGRTISYLGEAGTTPVLNLNGSQTLSGPVFFDNLEVNTKSGTSYHTAVNFYTLGNDIEFGENVTGSISAISAPNGGTALTTSMDDPWEVTVRSGGAGTAGTITATGGTNSEGVNRLNLTRYAVNYTGHAIFNVEDGGYVDSFHYNDGNASNLYGIEEINIKTGAQVRNYFNDNANKAINQNGLRYITVDGTVTNFYVCGASSFAVTAANNNDNGVQVMEFGPNASITAQTGGGIANETNLTHVYIFNNNAAAKSQVSGKTGGFASAPHCYAFQADGTGTVSAYMSTMPSADNSYACEFGGLVFDTTYTHAIIDDTTIVCLADLVDNQYPATNFAEGGTVHSISFANLGASFDNTADVKKSGYTADTEDDANRKYAIIASFRIDSIDSATTFGTYTYNSADETVQVASSELTDLATENGQYNVIIYDIPTTDTGVVVIPFLTIDGKILVGKTRTLTAGATADNTYYGTEAEVEDYFS